VRVTVLGRRDRLHSALQRAIEHTERETAGGSRLHLRVAVDYSGRDAILRAAQCLQPDQVPTHESFTRLLDIVDHGDGSVPPVDLLIRTGGEQRLSDFLLWESAYAELVFLPTFWPDVTEADLAAAVDEFRGRDRRFGGLAADGVAATATGA
jgi:undecaprenyl diphosphate synthase